MDNSIISVFTTSRSVSSLFFFAEANLSLLLEYLDVTSLNSCIHVNKLFNRAIVSESRGVWREIYGNLLKSNKLVSDDNSLSIILKKDIDFRFKACELNKILKHKNNLLKVDEFLSSNDTCISQLEPKTAFSAAAFPIPSARSSLGFETLVLQFGGCTTDFQATNSLGTFLYSSQDGNPSISDPNIGELNWHDNMFTPLERWLSASAQVGNKLFISGGESYDESLDDFFVISLSIMAPS